MLFDNLPMEVIVLSITAQDWDYEQNRLKKIYIIIHKEISKKMDEMKSYKDQIVSTRKLMWEEAPGAPGKFEEIVDIQPYLQGMKHEWEKHQFSQKMVNKLEKIEVSPYFARIDFKEENENNSEQIYIGIASLIDRDTREIYIYDWRAPISSVFYDYEIGPSKYTSPDGEVRGDVFLKRQFKIANCKIEYMFNSSVKIDDEVLQQVLGRSADDRMRNIVTTIQKEQNRIIRDEENDLLMVQGPAGSGKTSVALHRVAYLLYKYRDSKLSAKNIIIFSPNQVFNDYISHVLPELGEENMQQTTFTEYAKEFIGSSFKVEDFNEQMEYVLSEWDSRHYKTRIEGIRLKSSKDYLKTIQRYIEYLENEGIKFKDISFRNRTIITSDELMELFYKDYKTLPISRRLDKIKDRIFSIIEPIRRRKLKDIEEELVDSGEHMGEVKAASRLMVAKEFKEIREYVHEVCHMDAYKAYLKLYEEERLIFDLWDGMGDAQEFEEIRLMTLGMLRRKVLTYEDLPAFLIIKFALEGLPANSQIRHVVIDESQDYSLLQYEVIRQLFKGCGLTLLGDINQSIHPFVDINEFESLIEVMDTPKSALFFLNKSYRSTREIFEFSTAILSDNKGVEAIERKGEKPKIVEIQADKDVNEVIANEAMDFIKEGMKSVAIICKTEQQSRDVFDLLKEKINLNLITRDDEEFKAGISVIPSYLAKGLEFDVVLIYDASSRSYCEESERKLFYTICSRAMHKLRVYHSGELTPLISGVDEVLYER